MTVREIEIRGEFFGARDYIPPKKRLSGRGNGVAPFRRISGMRVSIVLCLSSPPFHSLRTACEVKTGVDSTLRNGRVTRAEVEEKRERWPPPVRTAPSPSSLFAGVLLLFFSYAAP